MKKLLTVGIVFSYIYWILLYFLIYLPLIIPRLSVWNNIPYIILILPIILFNILIASLGCNLSQKSIILNSIGNIIVIELFILTCSLFNLPAFKKSFEGNAVIDVLKHVLFLFVLLFINYEIGYLLKRLIYKILARPTTPNKT